MSTGPRYKVPFRRRREGVTDFHLRKRLLMGGKPRFVVRRSLNRVTVQVVQYAEGGDKITATALSSELKDFGWEGNSKNTPGAYLAGYLAAKRCIKEGTEEAVLDIGLRKPVPGSIPFAAVKGAIDAGLDIPVNDEVVPTEERIRGEHMTEGTPDKFEKVMKALEEAEI